MKIRYIQDTDTLYIELFPAQVGETRSLDENTRLDLDGEGQMCAIAIKRASSRIDLYSLMGLPGGVNSLLNLTVAEQGWLDEYRRQLAERFPGLVEDMFIYGLYARGYSDPDIEMKLLLLIREGDREKKDEISHMGYMLDMEGYFVAPFIDIYTRAEWAEQKRLGTGFYKSMTNDGIRVT
jgi:uncharacterized protein YuzE